MGLKWDQAEEIAEVLTENHPGINPLQARFTDLRQWVIDLDEFDDDPGAPAKVSWKPSRWLGMRFTRKTTKTNNYRNLSVLKQTDGARRAKPEANNQIRRFAQIRRNYLFAKRFR